MLKIAVFGFYNPDQARVAWPGTEAHLSPVSTQAFMRAVWEMEPPATRIGSAPDAPGFVRLSALGAQPVYVQSVSDQLAQGAGLLRCDGYIPIIDAVKILAPRTIQAALRRLRDAQPHADIILAAGRQNEPDALSCVEIRDILGLHPDLLIMPYVPSEPKTVQRLIRRMVRYIENPDRVPPPIFAGEEPSAPVEAGPPHPPREREPAPRLLGGDAVWLPVADLPRALAFYQDALGFRLMGQAEHLGRTLTHLYMGRGYLVLIEGDGQPAEGSIPGWPRFSLRVFGLDALVERLTRAGACVVQPPAAAPFGPRMAVLADPDGHLIALTEGDWTYSRR